MNIGQEIRHRRTLLGLTQDDVATSLKCSRRTISAWETGQNDPHWTDIVALATVLGEFSTSYDSKRHAAQAQERLRIEVEAKTETLKEEIIKLQAQASRANTKSVRLAKQVAQLQEGAIRGNTRFHRIFWVYGYTQVTVAQALDIHAETLSRYANGHLGWPDDIKAQMVEWFGELFFDDETHAPDSDELDD